MITIKGRTPSKKNSRNIVCRGRFPMNLPSDRYVAWHKEALAQLVGIEPIKSEHLRITIYPPDARKADLTNKAESVMDTLVDAGILEDDNWFVVNEITLKFGGIDKENPRAEIEEI